MQSPGGSGCKGRVSRHKKCAPDPKLRGKHFCTNLTSKGQRGVFLSLYHQGNYVRIQPAGKYEQTIWGWYSGSHGRRKRKGSLKCKHKRCLHKFKANARTAQYTRTLFTLPLRLEVSHFKRRRCKRKNQFSSSYVNVEVVHTNIFFYLRHSFELAITG